MGRILVRSQRMLASADDDSMKRLCSTFCREKVIPLVHFVDMRTFCDASAHIGYSEDDCR